MATGTEHYLEEEGRRDAPAVRYRPLLDVILEVAGHPALPDGYDTWGWKVVRPDLRSHGGFRWPLPGGTVTDLVARKSSNPCPTGETGGFCVALTAKGAASGGHGHETILLLAYQQADVLARDNHKIRVRAAYVADVVDGQQVYRTASGADLAGAYLGGADLRGADLVRADLGGAYLGGADLTGANLAGADLRGADLGGADRAGANLGGAHLGGASLGSAYLTDANLTGAYLGSANLTDANLTGANLTGAYLRGAVLP
jgi:hypothetical protein